MSARRGEWIFPPSVECVGEARELVRKTLADWGLPHFIERVTLIVSELTTNVVLHAATPLTLTLHVERGERLRGQVADGSSDLPAPGRPNDDAEGGRGLAIVDVLADAWGITPTANGKTVWFECRETC
ncbi:ATP-binding protein [Thermopolyspora sp. NPDC052614]|uniref:ATP-binding protein n=1 Tax=Thermopolyspora sp. NPDC052614 TaxID=3155682 RepID=UPI003442D0F2